MRNRRGASLIEVVIGSFLMTLSVVFTLPIFSALARWGAKSKSQGVAYLIVVNKLAEVKSLSPADITSEPDRVISQNGVEYHLVVDAAPVAGFDVKELREVTLTLR